MANRPLMRNRPCAQCGISPIAGYKFCSDACFQKNLYARRAESEAFREYNRRKVREWTVRKYGERVPGEGRGKRLDPHPCATCGELTQRPRFCSEKCIRGGDKGKANRRKGNSTRRARVALAIVERFDPLEVLERDGWKCHICKRATPKRLRGTYDPRAPELDHIIPIAAGGEHSRKNTACACRQCNIKKSDKPLGQLRLIP